MAIFVHTELQGNVDVNLTPDKRKVFLEKEAQIWDNLKEELKSMYLKIAPPILLDQSTTLTDFYDKVEPTKNEVTEEKIHRKISDNSVSNNGDCIRTKSLSSPLSNPVTIFHQHQKQNPKTLLHHDEEVSNNASLELSDIVHQSSEIEDSVNEMIMLEDHVHLEQPVIKKRKTPEIIEIRYDDDYHLESRKRKTTTASFSWSKVKDSIKKKCNNNRTIPKQSEQGRQFFRDFKNDKAELVEAELSRHLHKNSFEHPQIIGQFNEGFIIVKLLLNDIFLVSIYC